MQFLERSGRLIVRTPAKLNLYLEVLGRRADGYHEIDSLFQAVGLYDELELEPTMDGEIALAEEGIAVGTANLVHRAASALRDAGYLPQGSRAGVRIRLRKGIPFGSGLGGGSSDAAATLAALANLWRLRVRRADLAELGARLGSDVPFFLCGGTARCRGRGEIVTSYREAFDALPALQYVVLFPSLAVSTKTVYEAVDGGRTGEFALTPSSRLDTIPPASAPDALLGGGLLFNRLEEVACRLFPELERFRRRVRGELFLDVRMSGSGSAFFALCRDAARDGEEDAVDSVDVGARLVSELDSSSGAMGGVLDGVLLFRVPSLPSWSYPWLG